MRSFVDRETKKTKREVVDGQQRLRSIIDFASDKLTLSNRAKEYSGRKFSTLSNDEKDRFLQYAISVDQLVNADNRLVLEIFARLNSYNVKLNPPELRHAEFQGEFKWSVQEKAAELYDFWSENGIFSAGRMVRMYHTSLVAEMYGILLNGIQDSGQPKIRQTYLKYDDSGDFNRTEIERRFDNAIDYINENFIDDISETALVRPAHFLMLFAAVAHCIEAIPQGALSVEEFDEDAEIVDVNKARAAILDLAVTINLDDEPENKDDADFWNASSSSLQRIASRRKRFPVFVNALASE